ncbi:MAG: YbjQ family protein [Verrucomicrobiales bacterium]
MEFLVFLVLLLVGLVFGRMAENGHYKRIKEREERYKATPILTSRLLPEDRPVESARLAMGSVVIAVDYFKMFLSSWRMFFGGEMRSYSSLIDRARREAILRMRESASDADLFINLRFETADISGKMKGSPNVELFAYATAVRFRNH